MDEVVFELIYEPEGDSWRVTDEDGNFMGSGPTPVSAIRDAGQAIDDHIEELRNAETDDD